MISTRAVLCTGLPPAACWALRPELSSTITLIMILQRDRRGRKFNISAPVITHHRPRALPGRDFLASEEATLVHHCVAERISPASSGFSHFSSALGADTLQHFLLPYPARNNSIVSALGEFSRARLRYRRNRDFFRPSPVSHHAEEFTTFSLAFAWLSPKPRVWASVNSSGRSSFFLAMLHELDRHRARRFRGGTSCNMLNSGRPHSAPAEIIEFLARIEVVVVVGALGVFQCDSSPFGRQMLVGAAAI